MILPLEVARQTIEGLTILPAFEDLFSAEGKCAVFIAPIAPAAFRMLKISNRIIWELRIAYQARACIAPAPDGATGARIVASRSWQDTDRAIWKSRGCYWNVLLVDARRRYRVQLWNDAAVKCDRRIQDDRPHRERERESKEEVS